MAVRLREILFARGLFADLAPADDGELPGYEDRLAAAVDAVDCPGCGSTWWTTTTATPTWTGTTTAS